MIFYSDKNVYEAAKDRIRWIFDEFKSRRIVVSFSGGKDSTTVLHLVKEVMDERGIRSIPVFFCDQEVEAPQTIEYVREVMGYGWVEPFWIQSYFQEWNSSAGKWFNVWGPGENWCREKEPDNPYTDIKYDKTRHFKDVLDSMMRYHFGDDYVGLGGGQNPGKQHEAPRSYYIEVLQGCDLGEESFGQCSCVLSYMGLGP